MDTLRALADQLAAAAATADPLHRYQALRDLAPALKGAIAAEMDAAIAEARDIQPEDQVAERAGVTVHEVRRRVTAHRKRTGPPRGPGRPGRAAE
ncbi:hypothetical protein [Micromonospora aurantiaca (nom. illeg.)]|uniref:hypothetical protein n=1 Tax=Micromonospora aurantiaca (nom. illeg.) TaxID=47850 RepID=UPI0033C5044F